MASLSSGSSQSMANRIRGNSLSHQPSVLLLACPALSQVSALGTMEQKKEDIPTGDAALRSPREGSEQRAGGLYYA